LIFKRATKKNSKLRLGLIGPAGSGKTYTALTVAKHLGGRVALVDSENGSASKYANLFDFDVLELQSFSPTDFVNAIKAAEQAGYDVLIIDSLSHAWSGKQNSALELVDRAAARSKSGNSFAAWREVTPLHNKMVDAIVGANLHVIATLRSKTEYVIEENERGKKVPRKVGMAPIQRDGLEYEFDVVGDMDWENRLIVTKTRCPELAGAVMHQPGKDFVDVLKAWLDEGSEPEQEPPKRTEPVAPIPESNAKSSPPPAAVPTGPLYHSQFLDECAEIAGMAPREDIKRWVCDLTKTTKNYTDIPEDALRRLMDGGVKIKPSAALASFNAFVARVARAAS
jgi:hypothetical protein